MLHKLNLFAKIDRAKIFHRLKWIIPSALVGAILGYTYWYYFGCENGCTITSSWINSSIYGSLIGGLIGDSLITKNKKDMKGNFNEIIGENKPVLVDFHATWCGPCKMMSPILEQVSKEIGEDAKIIKIDVDSNPQLAQQYQVQSVPTLILFKDGKIVWRESGIKQADFLKNLIENNK